MTLEDNAFSDSFAPPDSSPDSYDTTSGTTAYPVDFSHLPSNPFTGRTKRYDAFLSKLIISRCTQVRNSIRRPLTQDEFDAIAYHTAKRASISCFGVPVGFLIGIYRTYRTRDIFRHPFSGPMKTENGWFNGERIRIMGREVASGPRARSFVHGVRGFNYVTLSILLFSLVNDIYAGVVTSIGEARDGRLKQVLPLVAEAQKTDLDKAKADLQRQLEERRDKRRKADPTGQGAKSASDLWKGHRGAIGADRTSDDDASPTSGGFEVEEGWMGAEGGEFVSDDQPPPRTTTTTTTKPPQRQANTPSRKPIPHQSSTDVPTTASDYQPLPSHSAWEKIRREAGSSASRSGRERRGDSTQQPEGELRDEEGDGFSFTGERAEAQREFDERIERERGGGDFSGGDEAGRQWRGRRL